ncbi:TetR/AcrR family transcriptional regulator [Sphaerisporangium sp. TRM90804]|uniref:TetR/AcrR family transcriptional regulator n=1 Tax=Sphaerisporangium sp. TRM90804 TaxID=3031113 RepID=UPI00244D2486|nr:TetR/AcrR family transcriptional regulator [Sphaerisporangium sp. TRM90804]MDH2428631.1 TetR family transcriptional regulator [Sphaerisporangium sp. TRM90804]
MSGESTQVRDREATSGRILAAARTLFAEHGYERVTVRMIASEAGANVALINRYFESKARLFAHVLVGESAMRSVIEGDPEGLPRRLAAHMAHRLSAGASDPIVRVIDRAGTSPEIRAVLRDRVESALTEPLRRHLPGPNARERAMLATSIILGGGSLRRVLGPESLREADPGFLEERLTAIFTACLAGPADGARTPAP